MLHNSNFSSGVAVANRSGAMEADTISKNGRSSKSQMSRGKYYNQSLSTNWFMKKISVFVCFLLISHSVFAVELWNGFNSDMTIDEAMARAREVLNLSVQPRIIDNSIAIFLEARASGNYSIPSTFQKIVLLSSRMEGLRGGSKSNIMMAFHNDKLFGIKVYWQAAPSDLLRLGRQNFGEPKALKYTYYSSGYGRNITEEWNWWRNNGRDIFWGYGAGDDSGKYFVYISQQAQQAYVEGVKRAEQQRASEQQRVRQEDASKVKL